MLVDIISGLLFLLAVGILASMVRGLLAVIVVTFLAYYYFTLGFSLITFGLALSWFLGIDPKLPPYEQPIFAIRYGKIIDLIGNIFIILGLIVLIISQF